MINLNLSSIVHSGVGTREQVDLELDQVELDDLVLRKLHGSLWLTRTEDGLLVVGTLNALANTECTRCLTLFLEPIAIELDATIGLAGAALTSEQPVRVNDNGWADIGPLVREYAWLSLPVNPICSRDCKGLCPECGGNRNLGECTCEETPRIDPRWEALRELGERAD